MTLRTLNHGNCGIFLIMGNAGSINSKGSLRALEGFVQGFDQGRAPGGIVRGFCKAQNPPRDPNIP